MQGQEWYSGRRYSGCIVANEIRSPMHILIRILFDNSEMEQVRQVFWSAS